MFCEPNLKRLDRKLMVFGVPVEAGQVCGLDMGRAAADFDPVMTLSAAPSESARKTPK
jgi:hypothetical protein